MASTQPNTTEALYKVLTSPKPDPQAAHVAIEEIRQLAGQNVIEILGAKIEAMSYEMKAGFTEVKAEIKALNSRIDAQTTVQKALESHIATQQKVSWALVGLLATTVFGLLYKLISG